MLDTWSHDVFLSHLHTVFVVSTSTDKLTLELVKLTDTSTSPNLETFALLFCGPATPLLQQGTYRLSHDQMGTAELFLVPVERRADGLYYEAVFNRHRR